MSPDLAHPSPTGTIMAIVLFVCFVFWRLLSSPGWPLAQCAAEEGLDLLILLSQSLAVYDCRHGLATIHSFMVVLSLYVCLPRPSFSLPLSPSQRYPVSSCSLPTEALSKTSVLGTLVVSACWGFLGDSPSSSCQ